MSLMVIISGLLAILPWTICCGQHDARSGRRSRYFTCSLSGSNLIRSSSSSRRSGCPPISQPRNRLSCLYCHQPHFRFIVVTEFRGVKRNGLGKRSLMSENLKADSRATPIFQLYISNMFLHVPIPYSRWGQHTKEGSIAQYTAHQSRISVFL